MEPARFLIVAVIGLALDLTVAWSAARLLGLPLWLCAAIGFTVAAIANYVLHELWTFRSASRRLSVTRALRYGYALGITLATRVCSVAALVAMFGDGQALLVLIVGSGISFIAHYLISKHLVFFDNKSIKDSYS